MSLFIFIAILVALIWVHELGHFSVAKLFRIRVLEFAVGFPPRLFVVQKGETKYTLNLILVGGYVHIWGENAGEGTGDPRALTSKNRWVQAAVLVAGVCFNVLFAWLLLSLGYMAGLPAGASQNVVGQVSGQRVVVVNVLPDSPASEAGVRSGDEVREVQTSNRFLEQGGDSQLVHAFLTEHQNESVVLGLVRDGEEVRFVLRAREGVVEGRKALGVQFGDIGTLKLPLHLAFVQGAATTWNITKNTAQGIGGLIGGLVRGGADLSGVAGPIGIASIGSQAVRAGYEQVVVITALISINLALINLLPIPGLDGGRLLIVAVEGITRRSVPQRVATSLMLAGFALIIVLMLLVSYQDIARLIG